MPTVETGVTELQLIENLPSIGVISNTDLALIQTSVQSYKTTFQNLITNIPDNTTITTNPSGKLRVNFSGAYPVGSLYFNASVSTNPASLLGFGTWEAFGEGRVLVGFKTGDSDFGTLGGTGGEKTHTLTVNQLPSHNHSYFNMGGAIGRFNAGGGLGNNNGQNAISGNTGGNEPHNNLQPYITVYIWKRIS